MKKLTLLLSICFLGSLSLSAQTDPGKGAPKVIIKGFEKTKESQWKGKRVAFLGDSMTDKRRVGTNWIYWEYLQDLLGFGASYVYGISGDQWTGIYKQAVKLYAEHPTDVDAICIFAGTNDYIHNTPMGHFFNIENKETNFNGTRVTRKFRTAIENDSTFCGRINKVMDFLKEKFPDQQIVILTPIHRAFANFNAKNVQPDENYCNGQGLFVEDYVNTIKQGASNWSVPLIDLFTISGLYPLAASQNKFFHNKDMDLLHPNAVGDYRIAKTLQYQLLALPSSFKTEN